MTTTLELLIKARDEASGTLKSVGDSSSGLGSKLGVLAAAATGAVAAFASFETLKSGIDTATELGDSVIKLSRVTGETTEQASALVFAFKHFGLSGDDATRSLGILEKKLKGVQDEETGVATGGKSTAEILKSIGVTAVDTAGNITPMADLMPQIADVFKAMPDGVEKTGLAMQIFGKSGKDMIPVLNQGSEGLKGLGEDADKLGLILDDQSTNKIKQYEFAQRDMGEALDGLKLQIGLAVMPVLTKLSVWFVEQVPAIRAFAHEGIEYAKKKFEEWKPTLLAVKAIVQEQLAAAIAQLKQTIEGLIPVGETILQFFKDNPVAIAAVVAVLGLLVVALFGVPAAIIAITAAGTLLLAHWDDIENKVTELLTTFRTDFPLLAAIVDDTWRTIRILVTTAIEVIKTIIQIWVDAITHIIEIATALWHGDFGAAWDGIKALFSDTLDHIWHLVDTGLGAVHDLIGSKLELVKEVFRVPLNALIGMTETAMNAVLGVVRGMLETLNGSVEVFGVELNPMAGHLDDMISKLHEVTLGRIPQIQGDMYGLGKTAQDSLTYGLQDSASRSALLHAVDDMASSIPTATRFALEEHSPSRVMMEIGGQVVAGLTAGMAGAMPTVQAAAASVAGLIGTPLFKVLASLRDAYFQHQIDFQAMLKGMLAAVNGTAPAIAAGVAAIGGTAGRAGTPPGTTGIPPGGRGTPLPGAALSEGMWSAISGLTGMNLNSRAPVEAASSALNLLYRTAGEMMQALYAFYSRGYGGVGGYAPIPFDTNSMFAALRAHGLAFLQGGTVPGPTGAPQLALVHGGERVLTPGQQGGGVHFHGPVTIRANTPQEWADYLRRRGGV